MKLLEFYLKSLILLKTKRVRDIGNRAQTRQHINGVFAAIGNDALSVFEKLVYADSHLARGKSPNGKPLLAEARAYYEARFIDSVETLLNLLAIIILFKYSRSQTDTQQLKQFIETNLIQSLQQRLAAMHEPADGKPIKERILAYKQLSHAVEINYE
jgi:hypothetical protein